MRKTASKRHRRKMSKTNGRMTKRVRKSRQSRKRNIYVGGGGAQSAALNSTAQLSVEKAISPQDKAFDKINTPNITYWNSLTESPFTVVRYMSGIHTYTKTIPGKWGHSFCIDHRQGASQDVYKNFDMIYKDTPNIKGEKVRNTYSELQHVTHFDIRPGNPYPEPPSGEVTKYTLRDENVTIGGVTYPKYNEAKHNPPQRTPGNGE
jgi:hypothetical protein